LRSERECRDYRPPPLPSSLVPLPSLLRLAGHPLSPYWDPSCSPGSPDTVSAYSDRRRVPFVTDAAAWPGCNAPRPQSIRTDSTIWMDAEEAAEMMMTQGFRHLPVIEGNTLVGIVSLRDILRMRIRRPTR